MTEKNPWFNKAATIRYSRPDWMSELSDELYLSELCIPGTHDTMSRFGGLIPECQSLTLESQLEAGIRALDIRLRHINDRFSIHHGPKFQHAWFADDVMNVIQLFLRAHPSETIIMRAQQTHTEKNITRTFGETFEWYMSLYEDIVWKGHSETGYKVPSCLKDVRGKVVILQDFTASDSQGNAMPDFGHQWRSLIIKDNYDVWWDHKSMNRKWSDIRGHIIAAMTDEKKQSWYVNFTSGSTHIFPVHVASGVLIWLKFCDGMNRRSFEYITNYYTGNHKPPRNPLDVNYCAPFTLDRGEHGRLGIIMMDYPGAILIDAIIAHNGLPQIYKLFTAGDKSGQRAVASNIRVDCFLALFILYNKISRAQTRVSHWSFSVILKPLLRGK